MTTLSDRVGIFPAGPESWIAGAKGRPAPLGMTVWRDKPAATRREKGGRLMFSSCSVVAIHQGGWPAIQLPNGRTTTWDGDVNGSRVGRERGRRERGRRGTKRREDAGLKPGATFGQRRSAQPRMAVPRSQRRDGGINPPLQIAAWRPPDGDRCRAALEVRGKVKPAPFESQIPKGCGTQDRPSGVRVLHPPDESGWERIQESRGVREWLGAEEGLWSNTCLCGCGRVRARRGRWRRR